MMMETVKVSETVDSCSELKRLIAREDCINLEIVQRYIAVIVIK
jgi:hypothetical protein